MNQEFNPFEQINDKTLSFNQPVTSEPLEYQKPIQDRFILKRQIIDKFTTKCTRVRLTPSTCDVCSLDIAEFNGLRNWNNVPEDKRTSIIAALKEHKKLVHPVREDLIVSQDELATQWLGDKVTTL
jgi:hypothetical protein